MRVSILTLGCKVNQSEMSDLESALVSGGHSIVGLDESPELCVINTCTVTAKSDYQSRQLIRRAARTGARVFVTGCYSEINKEETLSIEGVEQVIGNTEKNKLINLIPLKLKLSNDDIKINRNSRRSRSFVKVQDGCDHSCSYCLIWKARGRSRSFPMEEVIRRIEQSVGEGFQEVVLTGIHLGLYGRDLNNGISLSHLIESILKKTTVRRVRLSSLEINEIDERLIELLHDERVCPHLHIPLQSGDDQVLKDMNRFYDTREFRDRVGEIIRIHPDIALGTDIIAGYPSETRECFDRTCEFIGELPFTYMHVFPYSDRPGTVASSMRDIVGVPERKRRAAILREHALLKKEQYLKRQVGRNLNVLIERFIGSEAEKFQGTTENYLRTSGFHGGHSRGSIVRIRVLGIEGSEILGKIE